MEEIFVIIDNTTKKIAEGLGRSPRELSVYTAEKHAKAALKKLNMSSDFIVKKYIPVED